MRFGLTGVSARWDADRHAGRRRRGGITELIDGRRQALSTSWSDDKTSTEDLRVSLQNYRTLLDRVSSFQV